MPEPVSRYQSPAGVDRRPPSTAAAPPCGCRCRRRARRRAPSAAAIFVSAADDVARALDAGRVVGRADDDEVVVHHVEALRRRSPRRRTSPRRARRARRRRRRRRAAPVSSAWPVPCATTRTSMPDLLREDRQEIAEEAGLLGRGGRGDGDELAPAPRGATARARWPRPARMRATGRHGPLLACWCHQSRSPARKARASGVCGVVEERSRRAPARGAGRGGGRAPSSARRRACAEVVRGHHDGHAVGGRSRHHRLDRPWSRPGSSAARRLVEEEHLGLQRPGARHGEPLLLAAREAAAPGARRARRARSARAPHRARAPRSRAGRWPRSAQRVDEVGERRTAQQHRPLEHHGVRAGARARDRPSRRVRRSARSGRGRAAASRLLPAPFGPSTTVRRPRPDGSSMPSMSVAAPRGEAQVLEPERQGGALHALSPRASVPHAPTPKAPALSASVIASRMMPSAERQRRGRRGSSPARSPSSWCACAPAMLPPTMMTAPTSALARPKPASIAGQQAEAAVPEQRRDGAQPRRAERAELLLVLRPEILDHLARQRDDDRAGPARVCAMIIAVGREQQAERAERAGARQQRDRRRAPPRPAAGPSAR